MALIKINDRSFKQTAEAVFRINPSTREKFEDVEHLLSFMESFAHQYADDLKTTSFATGGFCLTFYPTMNGRGCSASVAPYTVLTYLELQDQRFKKLYEEMLK